jgi:squalene-hopene/tetraprenyl-beta-curcumene cyclase
MDRNDTPRARHVRAALDPTPAAPVKRTRKSGVHAASGPPRLEVDRAIERAQAALFAEQRADGAWNGVTDMGPVYVAFQLVVEKWIGVLSAEDAELGKKTLLREQRPDGSYLPFPYAPEGDVCATASVYAALAALGVPRSHPAVKRAVAFIEAHGGFEEVRAAFRREGDLAAVALLLAGLEGPEFLPALGLDFALLPFDKMISSRVHGGNLLGVFALMALRSKYAPKRTGLFGSLLRGAERVRLESFCAEFQNPDGSWNEVTFFTLLPVIALHAVGMSPSDETLRRALVWLDGMKTRGPDGLTIRPFHADVWSTGFAVLALLDSGIAASDARLQAAQEHLLRQQIKRPQHSQLQPKRDAVRVGGFPFQTGNETLPDVDDAGVVLGALGALAGTHGARALYRALDDGLRWVRDMQNGDGGFPSYVHGHDRRTPGPMFLKDLPIAYDDPKALWSFFIHPPPEYGDPSYESVTGRALWGFGASGIKKSDPAVARAIEFLKRHQCDSGAWWGRWMAVYLAETATILLGLEWVGEDMSAQYVRRAIDWICAVQNPDGGWGETPAAYRDPLLAGVGPSNAPLTAFAVLSLLAAVGPEDPAVKRGVAWLLSHQRSDGLWDQGYFLHTFIPPRQFYWFEIDGQTIPLWALGKYRRLCDARATTPLR